MLHVSQLQPEMSLFDLGAIQTQRRAQNPTNRSDTEGIEKKCFHTMKLVVSNLRGGREIFSAVG